MTLITGVDSSTQSTKVEVRDLETGRLVASGSVPHPAVTPPCAEQDPAAWEEAFAAAWKAAGTPHLEALSIAGRISRGPPSRGWSVGFWMVWPKGEAEGVEPDLTIDAEAIREVYARCRDEGAANPERPDEQK